MLETGSSFDSSHKRDTTGESAMFRRILLIATVIVVLLTAALAYNEGRLEDGSLVDLQRCGDGSDYYYRHESQCDTLEFYIPLFFGPFWLILVVMWIFAGLRRKAQTDG